MRYLRTNSVDETRAIGARLGELLRPGDVVLLQGPLGAGKTAMTQGIGRGAGSTDLVNSPTFVLINEYRGHVKLYHVDLYRLEDPEEILQLDLPGYTTDGVLIVEWPERGAGLLPEEHLHVGIEHDADASPDARRITLTAFGERAAELLRALSEAPVGAHG
ncbi:MAG TPA: tRNA (adenosine(37)-N6)-threonylcarbamoyltransferase complex ATPase subunit type 1 TsaE [Dehalococcoidia bacterium]|nr:tRNA (adenosine(37)-N6)-threonylcarbamoyltransferase complex ATPase subunit type 1 TsaE [Dehalococcoidia bacterium]